MTFLTKWWARRRERQQIQTRLDVYRWIVRYGEVWK